MAVHTALGEHGMIGDTRSSALVDRTGTITRLTWHVPGAAAPLHAQDMRPGGISAIRLEDAQPLAQSYRAGTTILDTYFAGPTGALKLTDFMPVALPGPGNEDEAGGGIRDGARIVRFLTCTRGTMAGRLILNLDGQARAPEELAPNLWSVPLGEITLRLEGALDIAVSGSRLAMPFTLKAGEQAHLALSCDAGSQAEQVRSVSAARKALAQCDAFWRAEGTPAQGAGSPRA
ncbi:trehalase-like domain-containing protein [Novosphingobium profundi]|uniref:trehalase-like domain-containing protein n=1 Tax=Novosphingobium profundi TaxID=1774954 RepID=UPI001CFCFE9A|nr:trehalase-like domain-containing protein [Novosphingobium profundi]